MRERVLAMLAICRCGDGVGHRRPEDGDDRHRDHEFDEGEARLREGPGARGQGPGEEARFALLLK